MYAIGMLRMTIIAGVFDILVPILMVLTTKVKHKRLFGYFKIVATFVYAALVLYITLFSRDNKALGSNTGITAFLSYSRLFQRDILLQIIMNILMFIPIGCVVPWLISSEKNNWLITLLIGFFLSVLIELMQLLFHLGLCELDDIINNTLGTIIGYLYWRLLNRLFFRKMNDIGEV